MAVGPRRAVEEKEMDRGRVEGGRVNMAKLIATGQKRTAPAKPLALLK
ncbi:hypothetical protein S7335_855 [Synechococcus sp. PCC 7335]|nr:hypothetical protein S7335_8 [Synechococcus sp. PCC 7335]EDX82408.1 hypothetical protein S7335_855 [Synechococcus sp. PCC 7335]